MFLPNFNRASYHQAARSRNNLILLFIVLGFTERFNWILIYVKSFFCQLEANFIKKKINNHCCSVIEDERRSILVELWELGAENRLVRARWLVTSKSALFCYLTGFSQKDPPTETSWNCRFAIKSLHFFKFVYFVDQVDSDILLEMWDYRLAQDNT